MTTCIRVPLFFFSQSSDLQIAAIGKRRTVIIFAKLCRFKYIFCVIKYRKWWLIPGCHIGNIIIFFILIMKFWNINLLNHFMINDQYKLDIVDRLVNCKTIKCNYVHNFMITRILYTSLMIISNYLFFDQTISCIKKFKYS
jgi:hypothetical protein